eukprot:3749706-Amphidinium_carterae.1
MTLVASAKPTVLALAGNPRNVPPLSQKFNKQLSRTFGCDFRVPPMSKIPTRSGFFDANPQHEYQPFSQGTNKKPSKHQQVLKFHWFKSVLLKAGIRRDAIFSLNSKSPKAGSINKSAQTV